MTVPSLDQITPDPPPRFPAQMRAVERRSFSAISPNPVKAISFASVRAFRYHNAPLLNRASTNKFEREYFADLGSGKMRLDVFQPSNRVARKRDQDVANDDASLVRGAVRVDVHNNRGGLFIPLQSFTKRIRQAHRLQADAKIPARYMPLLQKG